MRILDLFSGIGSFSLGLERAGMRTVAFCEQDAFCQAVLRKHWPNVPCHADVTTREFQEGEAEVICGGFPCQDLSHAGKRAGLAGERSGLYRELVRAIRVVRPRYAIMENVAALLGRGLDVVLGDLAEIGADAEWDCVPAAVVGAPHERDRIWIVAHTQSIAKREQANQGYAFTTGGHAWVEPSSVSEPSRFADNAADAADQQMGPAGQSWLNRSMEGERTYSDAQGVGCGQGRTRRPPDSFARIRDEACRNAADPYGARLAFRAGLTRDAWEKLPAAQRNVERNERQSIWPDEPALSGVDDGAADWMDRVKATGNTLVPQIPELIGRAIMNSAA